MPSLAARVAVADHRIRAQVFCLGNLQFFRIKVA
jgi:hypothetical protein